LKLPRLREVRERRGWNQSVLAEKADVSRNSISNYETGQREAYPLTARKLADALGVSLAELQEEPINRHARYLKQEAEHAAHLLEVVSSTKDALEHDRVDYATRFLEILDEGLRNLSESLDEAHRIEAGKEKMTAAEKTTDDSLSELLREWESEKA
jgi:transcriptional regulator with XRE-family HTH domain